MANSVKNSKSVSKFPAKFGKRENKLVGQNFSCAVIDADLTLAADDGIEYVRSTGANSVTLPKASESKGRVIHFIQTDAAALTIAQNADDANIDGADSAHTACDAADDQISLFCTGTEWIVVAQIIA